MPKPPGAGQTPGPPPAVTTPVANADAVYDPNNRTAQIEQQGSWSRGFGNPDPFIPSSPQGDPLDGAPFVPPPGFVDLDVSATEARTGRLMVGAGVNSSSGVVGNIVLSEDNFDISRVPTSWADIANGTAFRGAGQKLRIEAVPGNVVSRYLVSWTDPYFLDTDYSLGLSGFYFQRYYTDWNEERAGGRVNVGRQLTPYLGIGAVFRGEDVQISNQHIPTPALLQRVVGDNTLLTIGGTLTYDRRDSSLLPSEGQYAQLSYTQGIGEFIYPRVDLEATQFFTLNSRPDGTGKQILSIGGQLGFTGDDTPIFERYYAGGFQSLRGFAFPRRRPARPGREHRRSVPRGRVRTVHVPAAGERHAARSRVLRLRHRRRHRPPDRPAGERRCGVTSLDPCPRPGAARVRLRHPDREERFRPHANLQLLRRGLAVAPEKRLPRNAAGVGEAPVGGYDRASQSPHPPTPPPHDYRGAGYDPERGGRSERRPDGADGAARRGRPSRLVAVHVAAVH